MRAVNLIPRDSRSGGLTPALGRIGSAHVLIALLVIALGAVTAYVLTDNTVSSRKATLAGLHQQISHMQAEVTSLNKYQQFEKLAKERATTVRQIAATRFDWYRALSDLSKVVPANTTLQTLDATVAPGSGGGGSSGGGGVRGDIDAPALEMTGCTGNQDEVAQLMSRLRVINGVTRVTLQSSTKPEGSSSTGSSGGCSGTGPTFDMVVFFQPQAGSTTSASGTTAAGAG